MHDVIVVGGGIVGLATALKLLEKKPDIKLLLLEKEDKLSAHQTGNNSGVIHSGIYYKPGSLKAVNCRKGYRMLLDFCDTHGIKYELCGKVIVATDQRQLAALDTLYERGIQNGLQGLKRISKEELAQIEPHVAAISALQVPETGIIDYKEVSAKYAEIIQQKGGEIHTSEKVVNITLQKESLVVESSKRKYECKLLVNCSGLYSDKVAKMTGQQIDVKIIPFRGEYFKVKKEKHYLVNNLIYPVPDPAFPFLGVHFTRMIGGGIEAGPNAVLAFAREGYKKLKINFLELAETLMWPGFQKVAAKYWSTGFGEMYRSFSKSAFTKALQHLIPEIEKDDLEDGGAGIRAQACRRDGTLIDDFLIYENKYAVNVCNAPSPAATSSLAIGDTISDIIVKRI
ncbi:MAG: L-2-hydroxyglutarate oxidase [Cyclobacteriaceae bacterium]|nr:L-2-hydroxyglutarate oxidase [Cyclobacteriaceae bacterium]